MEKEEALRLLGLAGNASPGEITEAIEQKLFEQKNELLQKYMVPTLLLKRLRTIDQFLAAEECLTGPKEISDIFSHDLEGPYHTQTQFLEAYERNVSAAKLFVMNISSFDQLSLAVHELIDLQEVYMLMFTEQFNEFSEALPEEANTREIIDTGTLLQGLKAGDLHAHMIWNIERELARISKIRKIS